MIIIGEFWINTQDPFEPDGINYTESDNVLRDLAEVLIETFAVPMHHDGITGPKKRLKITIEEQK